MIVKDDIVYATTSRPLMWDIYQPGTVEQKSPAILVFHGGAYLGGSRKDMVAACTAFAEHGFVAIAPEYRLFAEAAWPAALADARQALGALKAQATSMGVDPDFIFCAGYSAGAHLSLLASASTGLAVGLAAFFPRVRLGPANAEAFGLPGPDDWAGASPITFADRLPPTIIFSGDDDMIVSSDDSVSLYQAMRAAGRTADLQLFSGLPHEFVTLPGMMDLTVASAAAFFKRTVIKKKEFDRSVDDIIQFWIRIRSEKSKP